jgi:hypothetical protein
LEKGGKGGKGGALTSQLLPNNPTVNIYSYKLILPTNYDQSKEWLNSFLLRHFREFSSSIS